MGAAITRWMVLGSCALAASCLPREPDDEEVAATNPAVFARLAHVPAGIAISPGGRTFVAFSRASGDPQPFGVGELRAGVVVPYPPGSAQDPGAPGAVVSAEALTFDARGRLWILDSGRLGDQPAAPPALRAIDLATNLVVQRIVLSPDVVGPASVLEDVQLDLAHGSAGTAFISDAASEGPAGLIVVDLGRGTMMRRLTDDPSTRPDPHLVTSAEGRPLIVRQGSLAGSPFRQGVDGLALDPDGHHLYYRPLTSRHLYRVNTDALVDPGWTDRDVAGTIEDLGDIGFASDGLLADSDGRVYLTDYENNSIWRFDTGRLALIAQSPGLLWPDALSLGPDGTLVCTASQLERSPRLGGTDERFRPFTVWQIATDSRPGPVGR
jgi:sugar lactone lactonase YvrE